MLGIDAIYALTDGPLGQHEAEVLQFIRDSLKRDEGEVRAAALDAMDIRDIAEFDADLLKSMSDSDRPDVRAEAITALAECGPAEADLPRIFAACKDDDSSVRAHAYVGRAIGSFGPKAVGAVDGLLKVVGHPDQDIGFARAHAIDALGKIGPQAAGALPAWDKRGESSPC